MSSRFHRVRRLSAIVGALTRSQRVGRGQEVVLPQMCSCRPRKKNRPVARAMSSDGRQSENGPFELRNGGPTFASFAHHTSAVQFGTPCRRTIWARVSSCPVPWSCPACRTTILHNQADARPHTAKAYRCCRCRLDLRFNALTDCLVILPFQTDDRIQPRRPATRGRVSALPAPRDRKPSTRPKAS